MWLIVAALISTGSETLIRSHPYFSRHPAGGHAIRHWVVPGLTALVLGAALNQAPDGPVWWLGLGISVLALLAVLVAEYIVVDPEDAAWDAAALALTGLAYALALSLFTLLYSLSLRAAISASVGGLASAALTWRLLVLKRAPSGPVTLYGALTGLVCAEALWAVSYWRLRPSNAGLLLMIPFYLSVGIAQQHLAGTLSRRVWIEYGAIGLVGLAVAGLFASAVGP
jgi:hypothetical protein